METKFQKDFPKCPRCGCDQTTTREAVLAHQDILKLDTFVAADHKAITLFDPDKVKGFMVPVLIHHIDYCWDCGLEYCTKVEVIQTPKETPKIINPNQPRGFPPNSPNRLFG
jgi:hypothetical protein